MSKTRRSFFTDSFKGALGLSVGSLVFPFAAGNGSNNNILRKIPTATGAINSNQLGITLMHEHVFHHTLIPDGKEKETIDHALKMLRDAKRVGIDTIVDLSPVRNSKMIQAVAAQVPINIILATGSYLQRLMPEWLVKMNEKEFKDHLRREITEGIDGSGIRPAIIKVAGDRTPLTEWEKEKFRAAAQIQKELDVPIGTHAIFNPGEQFDWLVKNGANPARLFFSHIEAEFGWGGQSKEQIGKELLRIAKAGGNLLFNNFGYEFDTPWEDLVYLMRFLCDNGCAKNVMTSMDSYWQWKDGKIITNVEDRHPHTRLKTFAYAITDAVPAMLKAGFSDKEVKQFLVHNPSQYFS